MVDSGWVAILMCFSATSTQIPGTWLSSSHQTMNAPAQMECAPTSACSLPFNFPGMQSAGLAILRTLQPGDANRAAKEPSPILQEQCLHASLACRASTRHPQRQRLVRLVQLEPSPQMFQAAV
jgi:hypothetical protein